MIKIFRLFLGLSRLASLSKMLILLHLFSGVAAESMNNVGGRDECVNQVLGCYFDVREYLQVGPPPTFCHSTRNY